MDLFDAVNQGNEPEVQKFISQSSAGINEVDEQGFTALHYAVKSKNLRMVETLCKYGAGVNERTTEGLLKTPLYMAADAGDLEMVKCLVQSQASIDLPSDSNRYKENGQTPLHRAAYKGHLNIVEFLVNECGADVNIVDADGSSPLHLAAFLGRKDVATFLTSKGADVDKVDSSGSTPLNCASDRGYLATVSFLLQKGAQLGQKDANGLTALHRAARNGNTNVVKHLLDSGADIEQEDKKGRTSLHIAARRGQKSCASLLLKRGANINQTDKSGQTPLHHAAEKGHLEMIEALLDKKAEINHRDETGETSLHITSKKGHPDILRYILAHGAKPDIQNNDGQTALDCTSNDHIRRIFSRFQKDGVILDSEDEFLFDSGFEDDESGGEPTQDELHNIANTVGSVLDLWELCKELRMEDDTIAKALPIAVHYTSIALQILKSWSQEKPGNEKAKKKILKTIPEYQRIRSGKTKKYDVLLEQLSTEIYTMTILLKMTSKLKYQARDVICQIDQSSSPPTKQRLWDATVELLSKWVVGGGKRDELLRTLQVRHLTEPAEVVSTAIQQEPGLADSFSFTTMDSEGGDIQLGEGDVQVSLPPNALGKETREVVTVKVPNHAPELICKEDEVQASPPVLCTPSGLAFDEPVKLTVPHCTSLDKITDETEVILYTSHGTADYTREVLSREDYTITDDSVVVNVRHFSLFTIVMRKLRGVKFGLLPLHPSIMPRSRKPLLQVFFYHMYKRNESKICEEHEHLNQKYIKAASPTEIPMDSLNEDLTIVCSDSKTEIKKTIAHTRLREKRFIKTSFELDFCKEKYGSKNITITLFQGSNKLETSILPIEMKEPEPTVPQQIAPDRVLTTSFEGCETTNKEDIKLLELSERIPNDKVRKLSTILGFFDAQAMRFVETNTRGAVVGTMGTIQMLHEWLMKTKPQLRKETLEKALMCCDLAEIAEIEVFLSVPADVHEEDEAEPSTPMRLVQQPGLERSISSGLGMVSFKNRNYRLDRTTKSQRDSRKQSVNGRFSLTD